MSTITWLHISDLHFRESQSDDSSVVTNALLTDLSRRADIAQELEKIDLIFITGDLAFSGRSIEYALAHTFLEELRKITRVPKARLFIIPGNHDVNRDLITEADRSLPNRLRTRQAVKELLDNPVRRAGTLNRLRNYGEFINNYFGSQLAFDNVRYFYTKTLKISQKQVTVTGLNTVWMSGSDADRHNLFLGEQQVRESIKLAQEKRADVRIALMHHPFDWLRDSDRKDCEALVLQNYDFILRGHLHETSLVFQKLPGASSFTIAAGACYDTREYPNSYNLVSCDLDMPGTNVYLRQYSDKDGGFWTPDTTTYRDVHGKYTISFPNVDKDKKPLGNSRIEKSDEGSSIKRRDISDNERPNTGIPPSYTDALDEWWGGRGYLSNPFAYDNAEDVPNNVLLERFQWWYVDPEMPVEQNGLGKPKFLDRVISFDTSDPVLIYLSKGGGKTFYRKFASKQIEEYSISIEIPNPVDGSFDKNQITVADIVKTIENTIHERYLKSIPQEQIDDARRTFSRLNRNIKSHVDIRKNIERVFVFVDGLDQLFDEKDRERNHRTLRAIADLCILVADHSDKILALRLFMPPELESPLKRLLGNKYDISIRSRRIEWDLDHCESILEARLRSYWKGGPSALNGGYIQGLLSQDALTEFRRGLQAVSFSPRCVISLLSDLGYYAFTHGVSVDQPINGEIVHEFMRNNAVDRCSQVKYPISNPIFVGRKLNLLLLAQHFISWISLMISCLANGARKIIDKLSKVTDWIGGFLLLAVLISSILYFLFCMIDGFRNRQGVDLPACFQRIWEFIIELMK